ncbi:hypothetical protein ACFY1L_52350 [Streptomyces sp. NPDC001663]|uniref:hypothetical protein n=1 Tax=Streptomyces sp. NPDC001663 TaxID=3364597 RepID=UPI003679C89E
MAPKAREVSRLILTHPDALPEPDRAPLKELASRCPELAHLRSLVEAFAEVLINCQGEDRLDNWLNSAKTSVRNSTVSPAAWAATSTSSARA